MTKEEGIKYEQLHTSLQQFKPACEDSTKSGLTKENLRAICKLATFQKDSMLIKYVACAASCRSAKEAKSVYGFQDFHKKDQLIKEALEQAKEIKNAIESLVKVKKRQCLSRMEYMKTNTKTNCEKIYKMKWWNGIQMTTLILQNQSFLKKSPIAIVKMR